MSPYEFGYELLPGHSFPGGTTLAGGTLILNKDAPAAEAKKNFNILHTHDIASSA